MFARSSRSRSLAVRRALRRRKEAGAALFVVSVTLALLAAMGVYGLTSTSLDVRSAGHNREAMVGQNVAQHTLMLTAETFSPSKAQGIINGMYGDNRTKDCKTTRKFTAGSVTKTNNAEACTRLNPARMQLLSIGPSSAQAPIGTGAGYIFQPDSFGKDWNGVPYTNTTAATVIQPEVQVEVSNPVAVSMPGFQSSDMNNQQKQFAQLTITVFTEMREPNKPPTTSVLGRGRIIVGPASLDEFR
jgi:hypothetical protein